MKKVQYLTLATLALLALTSMAGAAELPVQASLTLESNAAEIQQYRDYANDLGTSQWPELAALSDLASEMAQALELGDEEAFVAKNAVMSYRLGKLSKDLHLELLRIQLGVECRRPPVAEKGCGGSSGGGSTCTSDAECNSYCGPPLGGSCSGGYCACN